MRVITSKMLVLAGTAAFTLSACEKQTDIQPQNPKVEAVTGAQKAAAYSLSNWMGSVSSVASLAQLSIPGTHDSGARYEPTPGTAKCQTLSIADQLGAGTRFLDVRCRHFNNSFAIHHGPIYQNLTFDDVLKTCLGFLSANPTETIVMSVKEEYTPSNNTRTFEQTLDTYLSQNPDKWYLGEAVPTLGQVRGKIVLLRRFSATETPKGINASAWADDTTFEINTAQANLKVQDQYKVLDNATKWTAITKLLSESKASGTNRLYLNYTSGYQSDLFGIPTITAVANDINPRLTTFFDAQTTGHFGIVPMDFAETGRNRLIIKTNFSAAETAIQ